MERMGKGVGILLLIFSVFALCDDKTYYIQSIRTELHDQPQMNATKIADLKRGDRVTVVESKGNWFNVKFAGTTGWISRLFLSQYKPIGKADLATEVPQTVEKSSRRRSSSFAVSASARGLMANERGREGRELYRSDFEALQKVEEYNVPKEKLEKFQIEGKLATEGQGGN